jgi:UDP-3-O-[3-hydroxymyristoyl] glucosamine N-acyltransferase
MIGGQVGIVGHVQIADGTKINAQSGVSKSIKQKNTAITGSPAYDYTSALRSQAVSRNLPQMEKRLAELENWCSSYYMKRSVFKIHLAFTLHITTIYIVVLHAGNIFSAA